MIEEGDIILGWKINSDYFSNGNINSKGLLFKTLDIIGYVNSLRFCFIFIITMLTI